MYPNYIIKYKAYNPKIYTHIYTCTHKCVQYLQTDCKPSMAEIMYFM